jgi:GNAT superfamily N-acetyltransferase
VLAALFAGPPAVEPGLLLMPSVRDATPSRLAGRRRAARGARAAGRPRRATRKRRIERISRRICNGDDTEALGRGRTTPAARDRVRRHGVPARLNFTTPQAWIPDLIVSEARRSRGAGAALLARCEELARGRNCWSLSLESANWRDRAHAFYLGRASRTSPSRSRRACPRPPRTGRRSPGRPGRHWPDAVRLIQPSGDVVLLPRSGNAAPRLPRSSRCWARAARASSTWRNTSTSGAGRAEGPAARARRRRGLPGAFLERRGSPPPWSTRTSCGSTTRARPTGCLFLAMRLAQGEDLGRVLLARARSSRPGASTSRQDRSALDEAHARASSTAT